MREYPREMTKAIVAKVCRPGGLSYTQVAKESGTADQPSTVFAVLGDPCHRKNHSRIFHQKNASSLLQQ